MHARHIIKFEAYPAPLRDRHEMTLADESIVFDSCHTIEWYLDPGQLLSLGINFYQLLLTRLSLHSISLQQLPENTQNVEPRVRERVEDNTISARYSP